ncbi:SEC-C domain-containing protein [Candidatus Woesearchaeota archaeon]|nr:SEC-C domain-containing protein [Candidatus Woesearchaeota archaeon]
MIFKLSRNAPCPCGSGKKYKKCCLSLNEFTLRKEIEKVNILTDSMLHTSFGKLMLSEISKIDPKIRDNYVRRIARESPQEVEMLFRIIAEKEPTAENILSYGYLLADINQPRKAIEQFKKVLDVDKGNTYAYRALAEQYSKLKEFELAEKSYKQALILERDYKSDLWNYFEVLAKQKKFDFIEEEAKEILKEDRDNVVVAHYLLEAASLRNKEEYSGSAILNFLSLSVNDEDEKKWFNSIISQFNAKLDFNFKSKEKEEFQSKEELIESFKDDDIDNLIRDYNEHFDLFPNIYFINFSLGILYELRSNFQKAVFHYNRALENTKNLTNNAPFFVQKKSIEVIESTLKTAVSKIDKNAKPN